MKLKIGDPTLRLEDERLLRGEGNFTDDINPGDGLRVAFLRAPFAHARLTALDLEDARALAGVHLVASQTDLDADRSDEARSDQFFSISAQWKNLALSLISPSAVFHITAILFLASLLVLLQKDFFTQLFNA